MRLRRKGGRASMKQQLLQLADIDLRIEYLKHVITNQPQHLEAKVCLAQQYLANKRLLTAMEWAERVLAESTPSTSPFIVIELAELFTNVWKTKRRNTTQRLSSICYSEQRQELIRKSMSLYARLDSMSAIEPELREQLVFKAAYAREQSGDAKRALQAYLAIISAEYDNVDLAYVIFRAAVLLVHVCRYDEASKYLEYLVDEPLQAYGYEPVHLYALLYHCYLAVDLLGNARQVIQKILAAYVGAMRGRVEPEIIRQRLPLIRSTSHMWESFAAQAIERCDYFLALAYLNQGTSLKPNNIRLLVMLSETLAVLNLRKACEAVAQRAFELHPQNTEIVAVLLTLDPVRWKAKLHTIPASEPVGHESARTSDEELGYTGRRKEESFLGKLKVKEETTLSLKKYRWGESRLRKKTQSSQQPRQSSLPSIPADIRAKLQHLRDSVTRIIDSMAAMDINHHPIDGNRESNEENDEGVYLGADTRAWKQQLVFQINDDATQTPIKEYSLDDRLQATIVERRKQILEETFGKPDSAEEEHRNIRGAMIQSVFHSDMQLFHAVKVAELAKQHEYLRLRKVEERIFTPAQIEALDAAKLQMDAKTKRYDFSTASRVLSKGLTSTTGATAARQLFIRQLFEVRKHWRLVRIPGDRDTREMLAVDCSGRPTARTYSTASMHRFDEELVAVKPCERGVDYEQKTPRKLYSLHLSLETDSGEVVESAHSRPVVSCANGITSDIVLGLHDYCTRTRHSQICKRIFEQIMMDLRTAELQDTSFRLAPAGSRVHVHSNESVPLAATNSSSFLRAPQVVQQLPNVVRLRIASNRILCIQRKFEDAEEKQPPQSNQDMLPKLLLLLIEWMSQSMKPTWGKPGGNQPALTGVDSRDHKADAPMVFQLCWSAQFHLRVQEIEQALARIQTAAAGWTVETEVRRSATTTLFPTTATWSLQIKTATAVDMVIITLDRHEVEARVTLAQPSHKPSNRTIATQYQLETLCEAVLATALTRQFCKAVSGMIENIHLTPTSHVPSNIRSVEIERGGVHMLLTLAFQQHHFQVSLASFDPTQLGSERRLMTTEVAASSLSDAIQRVAAAIIS